MDNETSSNCCMQRGRGGIEFEDLVVGDGAVAARGTSVEVSYTLALNRGDIVESDRRCEFRIGGRTAIAGLEYGVEGMRTGGVRRIRVGPQLAYRDREVPGKIPSNAVLEFRVKLIRVETQGPDSDA
jgi:FKBP-type peptidyl-prolyl cis-trans isomerase